MRGKDVPDNPEASGHRITPAYAGKRCAALEGDRKVRDHPRVCGEKHGALVSWMWSAGSPPRMRGKVKTGSGTIGKAGITPAYAGKRDAPGIQGSDHGDHPRVCGEKHGPRTPGARATGSPPRMRGKASMRLCCFLQRRITPAYAGKSPARKHRPAVVGDHPRVCGEKVVRGVVVLYNEGSPPRMRGKAVEEQPRENEPGITPAYAGKSLRTLTLCSFRRDHPRVCGEKKLWKTPRAQRVGSPPRMRGKGCASSRATSKSRITPAYAGKSRAVRPC